MYSVLDFGRSGTPGYRRGSEEETRESKPGKPPNTPRRTQCATESRKVKVTKVLRPVQYWVLRELVAGGVARAVSGQGLMGTTLTVGRPRRLLGIV